MCNKELAPLVLFLTSDDDLVLSHAIHTEQHFHLDMNTALNLAQAIFKIKQEHFPEMTIPVSPMPALEKGELN